MDMRMNTLKALVEAIEKPLPAGSGGTGRETIPILQTFLDFPIDHATLVRDDDEDDEDDGRDDDGGDEHAT